MTVTDSAQLTGAEFEIWDSLTGGTCLYGGRREPEGDSGNQASGLGSGRYRKSIYRPTCAELRSGQPIIAIETKAPEGFQTPDGNTRTEFTVSRGEEDDRRMPP
ncbi:MAG: hypothetical protein ACLTT1_06470 [[Clostridium] scindens]